MQSRSLPTLAPICFSLGAAALVGCGGRIDRDSTTSIHVDAGACSTPCAPPDGGVLTGIVHLIGGGYSAERRLEAVQALAGVTAPCRQPALERVVRDGEGAIRAAAVAALARGARAAG